MSKFTWSIAIVGVSIAAGAAVLLSGSPVVGHHIPSETTHPPGYCDGLDDHACFPNACADVLAVVNSAQCENIQGQTTCNADRFMPGQGSFTLNRFPFPQGHWKEFDSQALHFLGCVASTESSQCPIWVLGVNSREPPKDLDGNYYPGCYFATSPEEDRWKDLRDAANASCMQGPNTYMIENGVPLNTDQSDLKYAEDHACLRAMGEAGGAGFRCHSWGTAVCAQNQDGTAASPQKLTDNDADIRYFGGLCPTGGTCIHNRGDSIPCFMYDMYFEGQQFPTTEKVCTLDWKNWSDWAKTPPIDTARYRAPTPAFCRGGRWFFRDHKLDWYAAWDSVSQTERVPGAKNDIDILRTSPTSNPHGHNR